MLCDDDTDWGIPSVTFSIAAPTFKAKKAATELLLNSYWHTVYQTMKVNKIIYLQCKLYYKVTKAHAINLPKITMLDNRIILKSLYYSGRSSMYVPVATAFLLCRSEQIL